MSSCDTNETTNCYFCNTRLVNQRLPYILVKGMKGVVLGVCNSCVKEQKETVECTGKCSCMIMAGALLINPRMKHEDEIANCNQSTYDALENKTSANQLRQIDESESYAVYYNHVERTYEVSDVEYAHGPDGIVERITQANMDDLDELKTIIRSCVGVSFNNDGVSIDGLPLIDWAVLHKKYNLIRAVGESGITVMNDDTAFSIAVEKDDDIALHLLVKYNLIFYDGAEGFVIMTGQEQLSAYDIGMKSTNPIIRSLVLYTSINPEMRRILNLDPAEIIKLVRVKGSVEVEA